MEESKLKLFKNVVGVVALLLCVLFFTLPLVQCSQNSSFNASGWEIATGTGEMFSESDNSYPLAFLLIIIPAILLAMAFTNKSFDVLRNISIVGLLVKIFFIIYANSLINSQELNVFELTGYNWLVTGLYVGLCALTYYCANNEIKKDVSEECQLENCKLIKIDKNGLVGIEHRVIFPCAPVRNGPSLDEESTRALKQNEIVTVFKKENDFSYIVTSDKQEGWVMTKLLEEH